MCALCVKNLGPNEGLLSPALDVIIMVWISFTFIGKSFHRHVILPNKGLQTELSKDTRFANVSTYS